MDGRRQRNALTAAENALRALAAGDAARARVDSAKAVELDEVGAFVGLPVGVSAVASVLDRGDTPGAADWAKLTAALPAGPLRAMAESLAP
jgi:hypothetical protein